MLKELGPMPEGLPMLMDRAYEGNETRQLVLALGMVPVVPPKSNRIDPWRYDRALYQKRNEIERLFPAHEGLPPHLLPFRKTRRPLPWLPRIRIYRRSPQIVLTRPSRNRTKLSEHQEPSLAIHSVVDAQRVTNG